MAVAWLGGRRNSFLARVAWEREMSGSSFPTPYRASAMTQHPLMAALTLSVPEMILAATAQRFIGLGPQAPRSAEGRPMRQISGRQLIHRDSQRRYLHHSRRPALRFHTRHASSAPRGFWHWCLRANSGPASGSDNPRRPRSPRACACRFPGSTRSRYSPDSVR